MAAGKKMRPKTPKVCPVCGDDVPRGALACPECGADHNSGWCEDAGNYDALDLGDEEFDYDRFVQDEFGSPIKPAGIKTIWWLTALLVLIALTALYFFTG
jgi:hypothetical protein